MIDKTKELTQEMIESLARETADDSTSRIHHAGMIKDMLKEQHIYVSRSLVMARMTAIYPIDLSAMLEMEELQMYISDKTGNDLFINDPERAERIHEAAEHGADGSTHAETIEDWRDYLSMADYPDWLKDRLGLEINEVELWHELNGSLDNVP